MTSHPHIVKKIPLRGVLVDAVLVDSRTIEQEACVYRIEDDEEFGDSEIRVTLVLLAVYRVLDQTNDQGLPIYLTETTTGMVTHPIDPEYDEDEEDDDD